MGKRDRLSELIAQARSFQFCGPSDDGDEQDAVTTGYLHLLVQLKRLATPLLPELDAAHLNAIEIDVHNIYSAYEARAEVDALLPDIEAALDLTDEAAFSIGSTSWIIDPRLVKRLASQQEENPRIGYLVRVSREINSCFQHGNIVATIQLMRCVLNYIPPLFGYQTFEQVIAQAGRSHKESFAHLENGLRKIADFHAHRRIGPADSYPSSAQVEPFKPQFELLLQEVSNRILPDSKAGQGLL